MDKISGCWTIQLFGMNHCRGCEFLNSKECGGESIRQLILSNQSKERLKERKMKEEKNKDELVGWLKNIIAFFRSRLTWREEDEKAYQQIKSLIEKEE